MWNIKLTYSKSRGFTLIEVILALAILSMVIVPLVAILGFSIRSCDIGEQKDELILNGRYAVEFIKGEVKMADKIICSKKIKGLRSMQPTNVGFVIMITENNKNNENYKYITYHIKGSNLIRTACTKSTKTYPTPSELSGYNTIAEFIDNIEESKVDLDQSMIYLDFKLKHRNEVLRINTDIYIRCPIDS